MARAPWQLLDWSASLLCVCAPQLACNGESLLLMHERWKKLTKDFYNHRKDKCVCGLCPVLTNQQGVASRWRSNEPPRFDLSKIPDIYDCIKYDSYHNAFIDSPRTRELFMYVSGVSHAVHAAS